MNVLKGLAISLLSLLLFLCLSIFGLVFTLNATLLDRDFTLAEVDRINMPAVTRDLTETYLLPQIPPELQVMKQPILDAVADFTPQLKQQLVTTVNSGYDYFLGKTDRLSITISLDPLKTGLRDKAYRAFTQNVPRELAGQPQPVIDQYFNQFFQQYSQAIPSTLPINESTLGPETMSVVRQVRAYIGYAGTAYWALPVLMLLIILAMIMISRDVKKVTRDIGVNFFIYGALDFAATLASKYVLPTIPISGLPQPLESWLPQFLNDLAAPLLTFGIILMAAGVALIVVSFVYRPRRAEAQAAP